MQVTLATACESPSHSFAIFFAMRSHVPVWLPKTTSTRAPIVVAVGGVGATIAVLEGALPP